MGQALPGPVMMMFHAEWKCSKFYLIIFILQFGVVILPELIRAKPHPLPRYDDFPLHHQVERRLGIRSLTGGHLHQLPFLSFPAASTPHLACRPLGH